MIGGVARSGSLLMIRNEARPRLTNRSAKPVVVGDSDGIRTWIAMTVWGAEYLGWNLRWIYGYPGSRELQLAIRQGEIDMWSTANVKLVKDLQREGVVQIVCTDEDQRREDFPDAPSFLRSSWVQKNPRAFPGRRIRLGPAHRIWISTWSRPRARRIICVKILRDAFAKLMKDPDVDKEGDKFFGDGWKAYQAEKIEAVIRDQTAFRKKPRITSPKLRQKYNLPIGETK